MSPRAARFDGLPVLAAILAGAAALRLYFLGGVAPLPDEYMQFYSSLHPQGLRGFLVLIRDNPHHLLLDPLIAFGIGRYAQTEFWLRLPSAVEGVLGVAGLWALGRRAGRPGLGAAAAALLALSGMHAEWSRRADFYALAALLSIAQTWLLFRALDEESPWILYALCAAAFLLSYPHAVLLAAAHGLFLATGAAQERRALRAWAACWGAAALAASPALWSFASRMGPETYLFAGGDWRRWRLLEFLARLPAFLALDTETLDPSGPWAAAAAAAFATAGLGLFAASVLVRLRRRAAPAPVRFAHLVVPFGLAAVLAGDAALGWYLAPRQLIWLLPFYLLAVADGGALAWDALRPRLPRPALCGSALAAVLIAAAAAADVRTAAALAEQSRGRERLLAAVAARLRPGDALAFDDDLLEHGLLYHLDADAFRRAEAFRSAPPGARFAGRAVALRLVEKAAAPGPVAGAWLFSGALDDVRVYPPAESRAKMGP